MYSLVYPAVLGTMMVTTLMGYAKGDIAPRYELSMAVFLILYFSSQHVENVTDQDTYTVFMLGSDLLEVLFMAILFLALGVYDPHYGISSYSDNQWLIFFSILALALASPVAARGFSSGSGIFPNPRESWLSGLSIAAILFCVIGGFTQQRELALILIYIVFAIYLFAFVFQLGKGWLFRDNENIPEIRIKAILDFLAQKHCCDSTSIEIISPKLIELNENDQSISISYKLNKNVQTKTISIKSEITVSE